MKPKDKKMIFTTLLSLLMGLPLASTVGCLESPLFDHATASPLGEGSSSVGEETNPSPCQIEFPQTQFCASITWDEPPVHGKMGQFTLRFWKKNESTQWGPYSPPPGELFVRLWMPSMNHGSSPVETSPLLDAQGQVVEGQFQVSRVYFIMGGAWDIEVYFKNGSQVMDLGKLPIEI